TSAFSSGVQFSRSPLAVTSLKPATADEKLPSVRPVPCVPVPTTPPNVWRSMSPIFLSPRPSFRSAGLTAHKGVAAPNVAVSFSLLTLLRPVNAARSTIMPSLAQTGVKEWPLPGARTVSSVERMAAASATSSLGATTCLGLLVTPPDQFDHLPPTIFMMSALQPLSGAVLAPDEVTSILQSRQKQGWPVTISDGG